MKKNKIMKIAELAGITRGKIISGYEIKRLNNQRMGKNTIDLYANNNVNLIIK